MSEPLKVFITYSHEDTDAREELRRRLSVMEQQGEITLWDDNEILPGDKWYKDISDNLTDSDILLYLVSASSLASENCNKELGEALGFEIRVIPIILESCDWQNHRLSEYEVLPDKGNPINEWTPESKAWQNVVNGIRKVVDKIQAQAKPSLSITQEEIEVLTYWILQQGNSLMMLKQVDSAIKAYSRATDLDPNYANAYNNRGAAYIDKGAYDLAIEDYTKAIELEPKLAVAYNNRGAAYADKGTYDFAIEDCSKAIELNPDYALAYYNRGNAYRSKGAYDCAIEDYTKAIELKPDDAESYINRGATYRNKGAYDCAIEDYTKAIELDPDSVVAYYNRGNAYIGKDDIDRAIEDYTKAIELDPDSVVAYYNRGNAYIDKDDIDRAIEDHIQAIELDPNYANAYFSRGMCWLHLQNWEEAKIDLIISNSMGRCCMNSIVGILVGCCFLFSCFFLLGTTGVCPNGSFD